MNCFKLAAVLCVAGSGLAFTTTAGAQNYPMASGDYVTMTSVTVDDGHGLDYANFLAGFWRQQEEFAKAQGWITSYEVMMNVDKRPGEPDLYLIERYGSMPTAAEEARREEAYRANFKMNDTQLDAASADRAKFRHVIGSQLLRVMRFK